MKHIFLLFTLIASYNAFSVTHEGTDGNPGAGPDILPSVSINFFVPGPRFYCLKEDNKLAKTENFVSQCPESIFIVAVKEQGWFFRTKFLECSYGNTTARCNAYYQNERQVLFVVSGTRFMLDL